MINKENDKLYIPKSIKDFSEAELTNLAKKIRKFMIAKNSSTGGHIGANKYCLDFSRLTGRLDSQPAKCQDL